MAGARALWRANGMKAEQMGRPIIAIVNSFTQFVPGHVHLHEIGQTVKKEIEKLGCFAAEFNTIAIDDGIAMGHDGMLYSLPSRDLIADSVEYMVNAHKADAMVCISNCDKITPGMLMAAMRLNIPTLFVSGGPMEAGHLDGRGLDLIDAMVESADESIDDEQVRRVEHAACPTCGSCSGMFTANSMNCLNEAIGLALPGNGTIVATHRNRERLFVEAARQIVENCQAYSRDGDESVLPRSIATRAAFLNAMTLDIAMGGSTNTVLHLLAIAREAGVDFTISDIDRLSRKSPVLCKVGSTATRWPRPSKPMPYVAAYARPRPNRCGTAHRATASTWYWARKRTTTTTSIPTAAQAVFATSNTPMSKTAAWPCSSATSLRTAASSRRPVSTKRYSTSRAGPRYSSRRKRLAKGYSAAGSRAATWW